MFKTKTANNFILLTFCLLLTTGLFAQKAEKGYADELTEKGAKTISIKIADDDDLTQTVFFTDTENQLLFIDFEALGEELTEIRVVTGEDIVYTENVTELPDNTIYEMNLAQYEKGKTYRILLKTNFGILAKTFSVN